jgi:hypothetical protein
MVQELDKNNAQRLIDSISDVYREYLRHKRLVVKYSLFLQSNGAVENENELD